MWGKKKKRGYFCRAKNVYSHISATCWSDQILNIHNWIVKDQPFHLAKRKSNYFKAIISFVHFVFLDLSATVTAWWIDLGGLSTILVGNWTLQREQELSFCLLCGTGVRFRLRCNVTLWKCHFHILKLHL